MTRLKKIQSKKKESKAKKIAELALLEEQNGTGDRPNDPKHANGNGSAVLGQEIDEDLLF